MKAQLSAKQREKLLTLQARRRALESVLSLPVLLIRQAADARAILAQVGDDLHSGCAHRLANKTTLKEWESTLDKAETLITKIIFGGDQ